MLIPQTEAEFQRLLVVEAVKAGWDWMHIGRVGKYAANGAKGTLGEGWPDLLLVKDRRLIFVEVKAQDGTLSREQKRVYMTLSRAAEYYVWRPSDLPLAMAVFYA